MFTKKIVSVRLFGEADMQVRYQEYLPAAIRAHHNLFPGWIYRIYHDHRIEQGPYYRAMRALHERGLLELRFVSADVQIEKAMLWCLLPLWDDTVDIFVIRDVDMIACYRERRAEEEWLRSGLAFHALSDKRGVHDWPTLNGMLGFRVRKARNLLNAGGSNYYAATLEDFFRRADWTEGQWSSNYRGSGPGADVQHRVSPLTTNNQFFLATQIWLRVRDHACEHRLSGSRTFGAKLSLTEVCAFEGEDLDVAEAIRTNSDAFIPYIGASRTHVPTMNLDRIVDFYREHGDPSVEQAITECEQISTDVIPVE